MRTLILSYASAMALAIMLAACNPARQPVSMTDQQLIQAVRNAAAGGATTTDVEARVGASPVINTIRPGDRQKLRAGTVELDSDQQSEVATLEAQDLAYWDRPGTFENPHVVGIAWLANGDAKVFFAVVYPPG